MSSLRQQYGYLPASAVLVLEAAGEDAMLRLVAAAGGTTVYVTRPDRLLALLGPEAGAAVHARCMTVGLTRLDVPRMTRTLEQERQRRILTLRAESMTVREIALTVGLTERGVYLALARAREGFDDRQMPFPGFV